MKKDHETISNKGIEFILRRLYKVGLVNRDSTGVRYSFQGIILNGEIWHYKGKVLFDAENNTFLSYPQGSLTGTSKPIDKRVFINTLKSYMFFVLQRGGFSPELYEVKGYYFQVSMVNVFLR